jgi:hypothetical protein
MTADQQRPGLLDLAQTALNNFPKNHHLHGFDWTGEDIHGQKRPATHGIDIA